jgi:hypothetical protein
LKDAANVSLLSLADLKAELGNDLKLKSEDVVAEEDSEPSTSADAKCI